MSGVGVSCSIFYRDNERLTIFVVSDNQSNPDGLIQTRPWLEPGWRESRNCGMHFDFENHGLNPGVTELPGVHELKPWLARHSNYRYAHGVDDGLTGASRTGSWVRKT